METHTDLDKRGADFTAFLGTGRKLMVDVKTRKPGCSRFWKEGRPDLALESWSVVPSSSCPTGVVGWTLDEHKITDLVLFTFAESDTDRCYMLPFQHLRIAFLRFRPTWLKTYGRNGEEARQATARGSTRYESRCLLVPAITVIGAVAEVCSGKLYLSKQS